MYRKHLFWTGVVIMLALTILNPRTALCTEWTTFDWQDGANLGAAYDMGQQKFMLPCVEVKSTLILPPGDEPRDGDHFKVEEDTHDVVADSNLQLEVALSLWGGKLNNKFEKIKTTKSRSTGKYLYAHTWKFEDPRVADLNQVSFTPAALRLVENMKSRVPGAEAVFKRTCGDGWVYGMKSGREYIGMARLRKEEVGKTDKFNNTLASSYDTALGSAKLSFGVGRKIDENFSISTMVIEDFSTGYPQGLKKPTSVTDIENIYKEFLDREGPQSPLKAFVLPYGAVPGYPSSDNPLARPSEQDTCINNLVTALLKLDDLINDADQATTQAFQYLFALGTDPKKREAHVNYIKKQIKAWKDESKILYNVTTDCVKHFNALSSQCIRLGQFYIENRGLDEQRLDVLPKRYGGPNSCTTYNVSVGDTLRKTLQTSDSTSGGQSDPGAPNAWPKFNLRKGDKEISGNECRVVAELQLYPDIYPGGRKLMADLLVAKIEWGPDRDFKRKPVGKNSTTYVAKNKGIILADLGGQQIPTGSDAPKIMTTEAENTYANCAFKHQSSPAGYVPHSCYRLSKYISPDLKNEGFGARPAVGCVDELSARGVHGTQGFRADGPILKSIDCIVDTPNDDDSGAVTNIDAITINIPLVHKYDLEADAKKFPAYPPPVPGILVDFYIPRAAMTDLWKQTAPYRWIGSPPTPAQQKSLNATKAKKTQKNNQMMASSKLNIPPQQRAIMQRRLQSAQIQQPQKPGTQTPQKQIKQPQKYPPMMLPPKQN